MTRRSVLVALAVLAVAVGTMFSIRALRQESSPPKLAGLNRALVVHFPTYGGYAPGILYNRGLQENPESLFSTHQGLDVTLKIIDSPETAISAFVKGGEGGGIDVMSFTLDMYAATHLDMQKSGLETAAILLTSWSHGGDAIAASRDIQAPVDLKGKSIACAQLTPSHFFALYVLNRAGLTNADVEWVFTQTAIDAANIFKAGRVDACVSWAPDVYTAAQGRDGGHILSSTKDTGKLIGDIFIVKRDFAETHSDVLARFCRGWLEGVDMARAEPDAAATYMAEAFKPAGIDKGAAEYLMSLVQFADAGENLRFFEINSEPAEDTYSGVYPSAGALWKQYGVVEDFAPAEGTYFSEPLRLSQDRQ